jgi:hypothetical protein
MKSKSSDMIRVVNDLIPTVKKLNDLCRDGHADKIVSGLGYLISAVEQGESLPSYANIDQKLQTILEKLDQAPAAPVSKVVQHQAIAPAVKQQVQQPAAKPRPAPQTIQIRIDHGTYAAHNFNTPDGQERFVMGIWKEVPAAWLADIERQVRVSGAWGMQPFKLEIAD